jgi:prefoldin subunit 5
MELHLRGLEQIHRMDRAIEALEQRIAHLEGELAKLDQARSA